MARRKPIIVEEYDSTREQFNAVVQGIYESLVKKHLGFPSNKAFKYRGSRLDERYDLEPQVARKLLSSAFAIATRRGQKHGDLMVGSQRASAKGSKRSRERIKDKKKLAENSRDYETTLSIVRKEAHQHRIVKKQGKFFVQPPNGFKKSGYTTKRGALNAIRRQDKNDLPRRSNGFWDDLFGGGKPKKKGQIASLDLYLYSVDLLNQMLEAQTTDQTRFLKQGSKKKSYDGSSLSQALKDAQEWDVEDPYSIRGLACKGRIAIIVANMNDGTKKYLDRSTNKLRSHDQLLKEVRQVCKDLRKAANPSRQNPFQHDWIKEVNWTKAFHQGKGQRSSKQRVFKQAAKYQAEKRLGGKAVQRQWDESMEMRAFIVEEKQYPSEFMDPNTGQVHWMYDKCPLISYYTVVVQAPLYKFYHISYADKTYEKDGRTFTKKVKVLTPRFNPKVWRPANWAGYLSRNLRTDVIGEVRTRTEDKSRKKLEELEAESDPQKRMRLREELNALDEKFQEELEDAELRVFSRQIGSARDNTIVYMEYNVPPVTDLPFGVSPTGAGFNREAFELNYPTIVTGYTMWAESLKAASQAKGLPRTELTSIFAPIYPVIECFGQRISSIDPLANMGVLVLALRALEILCKKPSLFKQGQTDINLNDIITDGTFVHLFRSLKGEEGPLNRWLKSQGKEPIIFPPYRGGKKAEGRKVKGVRARQAKAVELGGPVVGAPQLSASEEEAIAKEKELKYVKIGFMKQFYPSLREGRKTLTTRKSSLGMQKGEKRRTKVDGINLIVEALGENTFRETAEIAGGVTSWFHAEGILPSDGSVTMLSGSKEKIPAGAKGQRDLADLAKSLKEERILPKYGVDWVADPSKKLYIFRLVGAPQLSVATVEAMPTVSEAAKPKGGEAEEPQSFSIRPAPETLPEWLEKGRAKYMAQQKSGDPLYRLIEREYFRYSEAAHDKEEKGEEVPLRTAKRLELLTKLRASLPQSMAQKKEAIQSLLDRRIIVKDQVSGLLRAKKNPYRRRRNPPRRRRPLY